jgi:hypothetical protein
MRYHHSAGTWGTALIPASAVYIATGYNENPTMQRGPWNGGVAFPNERSAFSTAGVSADKFPLYDGTSWTYAAVTVIQNGALAQYRDSITASYVGAESGCAYVWAVGVKYNSYSDSGTAGLYKYDGVSWTLAVPQGTAYAQRGFVSTGHGGLICWQADNAAIKPARFFHCKDGSAHEIGTALFSSSFALTTYSAPCPVGDWSGTRVGDLYFATTNGYCLFYGTTAFYGLMKLPSNGTSHDPIQQYSARYQGPSGLAGIGLIS